MIRSSSGWCCRGIRLSLSKTNCFFIAFRDGSVMDIFYLSCSLSGRFLFRSGMFPAYHYNKTSSCRCTIVLKRYFCICWSDQMNKIQWLNNTAIHLLERSHKQTLLIEKMLVNLTTGNFVQWLLVWFLYCKAFFRFNFFQN